MALEDLVDAFSAVITALFVSLTLQFVAITLIIKVTHSPAGNNILELIIFLNCHWTTFLNC
jgi:hypothetical protein